MLLQKYGPLIGVVLSLVLCLGIILVATNGSGLDNKASAYNNREWFLTTEETDAYEFPTYTGTEPLEWLDGIAFLQVPEEALKAMSTDGLIETCLTYPEYAAGMIFSNHSMYAGFQGTLENFNGFAELFQREDAGQKLLALYRGIDQGEAVSSSDSYILRMRYIEFLLAQNEVLTKLSVEERNVLQTACIHNVNERVQKYYEQLPLDSPIFLIARISYMDNSVFIAYAEEHSEIMFFLNTSMMLPLTEAELAEFEAAINIQWEIN